jgi:hypothetical protein
LTVIFFTFKPWHAAADVSRCVEVAELSLEVRLDVHRQFWVDFRPVESCVRKLVTQPHVLARVVNALGYVLKMKKEMSQ